jgi:hypothetical protein
VATSPTQATPKREHLWTLFKADQRVACELRYHSEWGVEVQTFRNLETVSVGVLLTVLVPTAGLAQTADADFGHGTVVVGLGTMGYDNRSWRSQDGRDDGFVSVMASVFIIRRLGVGLEGAFGSTDAHNNVKFVGTEHDEFHERVLLAAVRPRLLTAFFGGTGMGLALDIVAGVGSLWQDWRISVTSPGTGDEHITNYHEQALTLMTGFDVPLYISRHVVVIPALRFYFLDHGRVFANAEPAWRLRAGLMLSGGFKW